MIWFTALIIVLAAVSAKNDGRREITCFQSHDLDFNSATARKRSNCGHCVYQETLMGHDVVAVTRQCVGQECNPYEDVVDGYGKNRFCCTTDLCNESKERGKFSNGPNPI
ncbi:hypothetical protein T265_12276 [Opisthorchis viverrini]|uniref:UPAR/Ly6 domain-containing protein n=1 Tax=Opisthorchis viverrini TaxID=6198 RepID=A0A074ZT42_OPIVI|nr:hypothetical protein T265_12276 [Opisthorchis viverrini]KER18434.1 hypothetical protein T265_12276 [Opisthorchis viverrini]